MTYEECDALLAAYGNLVAEKAAHPDSGGESVVNAIDTLGQFIVGLLYTALKRIDEREGR